MQRVMLGSLCCIALALASSCRNSTPPPTDIVFGDGFGAAQGTASDGTHIYKKPSELLDYAMISKEQFPPLMAWCFDVSEEQATKIVTQMIQRKNAN